MGPKKYRSFVGFAIPMFLNMFSTTANANLIDDTYGVGAGSFELGTFVDNGIGFMGLAPGSATITGWNVGGPGTGVDWLISPNYRADTGNHSVDLQRTSNGSITTVIPTVAGNLYELRFGAAALDQYQGIPIDPGNANGVVSAGTLVNQLFTAQLSADISTQIFTPFSFMFNATGPQTTITITSIGPGGSGPQSYGPVIDSVSIIAVPIGAVPEPNTAWLFVSTFLGLAFLQNARGIRKH